MKQRKTKKSLAVLFLIGVLVLTGCGKDIKITTGLGENEIFKLSGNPEKLSEVLILLVNEKNKYEKNLGKDIWSRTFSDISLETEVKEQVKSTMIELSVIYRMAVRDDFSLKEDEQTVLAAAAKEYYDSLTETEKQQTGITETDILHLYEKMYLTDKYYESKTGGLAEEISDETARVMRVMYIYFKTGERDIRGEVTPYEPEVLDAVRQRAGEAAEKVAQNMDFYSLVQQYSDDDEYEAVFGRGTMEQAFEEAAFELTDGACSGLVETEGGIYLIKCIEDYLPSETEENKTAMQEQYRAEKFEEIYEPFLEKQELEFNNKVWKNISISNYTECDTISLYDVYYKQVQNAGGVPAE